MKGLFSIRDSKHFKFLKSSVFDHLFLPDFEPVLDRVFVLHLERRRLRSFHVHCKQPVLKRKVPLKESASPNAVQKRSF